MNAWDGNKGFCEIFSGGKWKDTIHLKNVKSTVFG